MNVPLMRHSKWMSSLLLATLFGWLSWSLAPGICAEPTLTGTAERWKVIEVLFEQPSITAELVDERVIGEVHPASERFYVRAGNMGDDAVSQALSWDVGRYTGFSPGDPSARALFQRGANDSGRGSAVQIQGHQIGIWIDSDCPRPQRGDLLPVCPAYWWWNLDRAPRPFTNNRRELSFALEMKVPTAERTGQAQVYVCAHLLFRDATSGRSFWFGASLFDLRPVSTFPDTVHIDNWAGGTGLPILFAALTDQSDWLHPSPNSARFAGRTFGDFKRFELRVGTAELCKAIRAMKSRRPELAHMSEESRDYLLVHLNVNPEVFAPEGSRGRLGLTLRNICVQLGENEREKSRAP
jgi:hypothetical protein